jgi:hypothetical protein
VDKISCSTTAYAPFAQNLFSVSLGWSDMAVTSKALCEYMEFD